MPSPNSRFSPRRVRDIADLIAANPLAWVLSPEAGATAATPLPLLAECDARGRVVALFGHMARGNPHTRILEREPRAMILFQGPNGFISPRLISKPGWGPTWNYASVWFETRLRFSPEETLSAVERLAVSLESGQAEPWRPEFMGERLHQLLPGIVAFRAEVLETHATFKLGQDEAPETFAEIVSGVRNTALVELMEDQRPDPD